MRWVVVVLVLGVSLPVRAQVGYWQQRADYVMSVYLDPKTHKLRGEQKLTYYNQSPDTLQKVYYHLYFNAFQPGSMMDVRSRTIEDPDQRVKDRIMHLTPQEQGYQRILSLTQNGKSLKYVTEGTVLVVYLEESLLPGQRTLFEMKFEAQVPLQIRRSGRRNAEGIAYSMSQWYPKMAEYDYQGWHAFQYIGREFHGVWGNFDVKIHIDSAYTVAATGMLQNAEEVGKGYAYTQSYDSYDDSQKGVRDNMLDVQKDTQKHFQSGAYHFALQGPAAYLSQSTQTCSQYDMRDSTVQSKFRSTTHDTQSDSPYDSQYGAEGSTLKSTLVWHFVAENVHDFVWAADKHYIHDTLQVANGPLLRFFYTPKVKETWELMKPYAAQAFVYLSKNFGLYPYPVYSIIQGGDGGMEYPMATLVTGERSLKSLVNVVVHEAAHSWYQGLLATNESRYAWMDEGFTTYATHLTMHEIFKDSGTEAPFEGLQQYYRKVHTSGKEERMNTLADHFLRNMAYSMASYAKGALFLHQLSYVVGTNTLLRGLKQYFNTYQYKHPTPWDFLRIIEKTADMHLGWYYEYMVNSTASVDYGVYSVSKGRRAKHTRITLERKGTMPMPIELRLSKKDGQQQFYYIPLRAMYGIKQVGEQVLSRDILSPWPWTHPYYTFEIPVEIKKIRKLDIDPSRRLLDINLKNQSLQFDEWKKKSHDESLSTLTFEGKLHTEKKRSK